MNPPRIPFEAELTIPKPAAGWRIVSSLLVNRLPTSPGWDPVPRMVISAHLDPDTITFFDDDDA